MVLSYRETLDAEILFEGCADERASRLVDPTVIEIKLDHALIYQNELCDCLRSNVLEVVIPQIEVLERLVLLKAFTKIQGLFAINSTICEVKQL